VAFQSEVSTQPTRWCGGAESDGTSLVRIQTLIRYSSQGNGGGGDRECFLTVGRVAQVVEQCPFNPFAIVVKPYKYLCLEPLTKSW